MLYEQNSRGSSAERSHNNHSLILALVKGTREEKRNRRKDQPKLTGQTPAPCISRNKLTCVRPSVDSDLW